MKFNGVEILPSIIHLTKQYFIDIHHKCITGASEGKFFVNDLNSYIDWQQEMINDLDNGKSDYSFTFIQRAYWLQSGQCIALLP